MIFWNSTIPRYFLTDLRCAVYGCARSVALQAPLPWMLDLELTLASLVAGMSRSVLREGPATTSLSEELASPFFEKGLRLNLLKDIAGADDKQGMMADTELVPEQAAEDLVDTFLCEFGEERVRQHSGKLTGFVGFASLWLQEKLRGGPWLFNAAHLSLGMQCAAAFLSVSGLVEAALSYQPGVSQPGSLSEYSAPPHALVHLLEQAFEVVKSVIVDQRRNQQLAVQAKTDRRVSYTASIHVYVFMDCFRDNRIAFIFPLHFQHFFMHPFIFLAHSG